MIFPIILFYVVLSSNLVELTEDDPFYKYWDAMTTLVIKDDFMILNGFSFVDRDNMVYNTANVMQTSIDTKLYVRQCYKEVGNIILNNTDMNAVITGTPGIGKTMFRNYMVYLIINRMRDSDVRQEFAIALDKSPGDTGVRLYKACSDNGKLTWSAYDCTRSAYRYYAEHISTIERLWFLYH